MKQMGAFLPWLQKDETIYSWCATAHAMSGWRSAQQWSSALLGAPHSPRQLDFPAYLPHLLKTALHHLTLEQALRRHTTAGMFLPFMKGSMLNRLRGMESGSDPAWPNTAQFMQKALFCHSRTLSWKPELRYCPECAQEDVSRIGRAYWHTHHQWPLSRCCTLHRAPLLSQSGSSKTWRLPRDTNAHDVTHVRPADPFNVGATIQRVAMAFSQFDVVDTKTLRASALLRLQQLGVIHSMHSVRHTRLHAWYRTQPVAAWLAAVSCRLTALAQPDWIPKLLWRRTQDHPIRWIILWSALGWTDEESAVDALNAALSGSACDENGQLRLFEEDGLGKASVLATPTPKAFRQALETASSYKDLMMQLQATRGDVVRWLEADPACRQIWRERLKNHSVDSAEQTLTSLIRNTSPESIADLKNAAGKEFRLLRRHAPDRLTALLLAIPSERYAQRKLWTILPILGEVSASNQTVSPHNE